MLVLVLMLVSFALVALAILAARASPRLRVTYERGVRTSVDGKIRAALLADFDAVALASGFSGHLAIHEPGRLELSRGTDDRIRQRFLNVFALEA